MPDVPNERASSRYVFCPYCGDRLAEIADEHGDVRPTCPKSQCGFIDYGSPKPCVAVLIERGGKLLLARRAVAPAKGKWDIPGGFIDGGESAEDAVRREIEEETSFVPEGIEYVGSTADVYGRRNAPTLNLCFRAELREAAVQPGSDVAEFRWWVPSSLPAADEMAFAHQSSLLARWRESAAAAARALH